jgi:hypothetical protein
MTVFATGTKLERKRPSWLPVNIGKSHSITILSISKKQAPAEKMCYKMLGLLTSRDPQCCGSDEKANINHANSLSRRQAREAVPDSPSDGRNRKSNMGVIEIEKNEDP